MVNPAMHVLQYRGSGTSQPARFLIFATPFCLPLCPGHITLLVFMERGWKAREIDDTGPAVLSPVPSLLLDPRPVS